MIDTALERPTLTAPSQLVAQWLGDFERALSAADIGAVARLFVQTSYWRDLVTFTWNITTLEGRDGISAMLEENLARVQARAFTLTDEATTVDGVTEGRFTFETAVARGNGFVRLKDGGCWTLLTAMTELKGFEEKRGPMRERGAEHGAIRARKSWLERRTDRAGELGYTEQPYCLVIGGGQGGIALGARLEHLGVSTIVIDKHERPGDAWRKRYKSLCLHDPVWYDHLPYLPFPESWPVYAPKDRIGDWLEMYVKVMNLHYWVSTECKSATYDSDAQQWTVVVEREGQLVTLQPKHLVLATGMSGIPRLPEYRGMDRFAGVSHHSSRHPGGAEFAGKKCVVIGSNNSAHDICADLWEQGADVTMVQRSSTLVVKSETLNEVTTAPLYSETAVANGMTTDKADMLFASIPYRIMADLQRPLYAEIARRDAEFYATLGQAGFLLDWGDDDSGLFMKYLRRGSGYYIDVGASELIATGEIILKSGVDVVEVKEHSLVLSDGSELSADLIVYATGYGSMNGWAAKLMSQEIADKVGKCWGLGSGTTKDPGPWEGELRNMWKPTHQEALWFQGGNLHQSRHYSLYLALQLKARQEGIPTPVYGMTPVHHLS